MTCRFLPPCSMQARCMSKCAATRSPRVAIAYLRASKDEQRLSREAQRASIEAWAMREGVRVAAWCTDHGVRSVSPMAERPALRAALVGPASGHAPGCSSSQGGDRHSRRERRACTETLRPTFIRTVIDGAAQYEHGLIRSRTCAALAAKRARGERIGSVPLGFALDADGVRLVVDKREQATIARARELRASGLSLRAVAAHAPKGTSAAPGGSSWRSRSHAWSRLQSVASRVALDIALALR